MIFICANCGSLQETDADCIDNGTTLSCRECGKPTIVELHTERGYRGCHLVLSSRPPDRPDHWWMQGDTLEMVRIYESEFGLKVRFPNGDIWLLDSFCHHHKCYLWAGPVPKPVAAFFPEKKPEGDGRECGFRHVKAVGDAVICGLTSRGSVDIHEGLPCPGKDRCPFWRMLRLLEENRHIPNLLEALQTLLDEQNGPPLLRREKEWRAAVDKARAVIGEIDKSLGS